MEMFCIECGETISKLEYEQGDGWCRKCNKTGGNQMKNKTRKEVQKENKEKKKFNKGYEAWPEEQQKTMMFGINVTKQKRDEFLQELQTEKIGLQEMDKEVQLNVENAALAVKAAKMGLAALLLDQKIGITVNKHKNRVMELEAEIK